MMRRSIPLLISLVLAVCCATPEATDLEAVDASEASRPTLPPVGVVEAGDGIEIAYEASGSGETTLVLVHCWACDRSFWRQQIAPFGQSRRVVAIDLPGHGESGTDRDSWSISGLAADVGSVLEALDLDRVVLVGHSMGGPVALITAAQQQERVLGVALVDTVHNAEQDWSAEDAEPVIAAFEEDFEASTLQMVPMMFPEGADPELVSWVAERANAADREAARALLADFPNLKLAQILSDAGVPVRAVNAAPLGMMIPETAVETNRQYADFDAAILEGVGHYLMLEKPAEFNALLEAAITDIEQQ